MRVYLYIIAGITSALLGWNIGQFFLTDLGLLPQFPEVVLFPCIAISLAFGMVMNEIFISNPTRPKRSLQTAKKPLLIALGLGTLSGLIAGIISQILFLPIMRVPTPIVRTLGWLLIGISVGIAEGLSWWWHSIEAGSKKRFQQRLKTSVLAAIGASFTAAVLFEIIRLNWGKMPAEFKGIEDPIGFSILGLLLGAAFSLTNSPSYIAALRAGRGFEYVEFKYFPQDYTEDYTQEYPQKYIDFKIDFKDHPQESIESKNDFQESVESIESQDDFQESVESVKSIESQDDFQESVESVKSIESQDDFQESVKSVKSIESQDDFQESVESVKSIESQDDFQESVESVKSIESQDDFQESVESVESIESQDDFQESVKSIESKDDPQYPPISKINESYPSIDKSILSFTTENNDINDDEIEEGLSIQLPGSGTIRIGCTVENTHISIPGLPPHVADIKLEKRTATLIPDNKFFNAIEVNGTRLKSRRSIPLKHNYVLTFYTISVDGINEEKYYRFVYYNRFLDPQG